MHMQKSPQLERCLLDEGASGLTGEGDKNPHMQHRAALKAQTTTTGIWGGE